MNTPDTYFMHPMTKVRIYTATKAKGEAKEMLELAIESYKALQTELEQLKQPKLPTKYVKADLYVNGANVTIPVPEAFERATKKDDGAK